MKRLFGAPFFFLLFLISSALSQCPKLPSGRCWIDCTLPHIHQILCEEVDYFALHDDLKAYDEGLAEAQANVSLAIWNSHDLHTVETNALHHLEKYMVHLTLQSLQGLLFFPMLREFPRLTELHIHDCPSVTEFDLTILPASLERLTLLRTGVGRLENRVGQTLQLPALSRFIFQENLVTFMQSDFFKSFPSLQDVTFSGNYFDLKTIESGFLTTVKPLESLSFNNNRFAATMSPLLLSRLFFGLVELSNYDQTMIILNLGYNSGLGITQEAVELIGQKFKRLTQLNLRFANFSSMVNSASIFQGLRSVTFVDFGYTSLPARDGAFAGATMLETLRLDGNNFGDALDRVNLFSGLESSKLKNLNLANNRLRGLPSGSDFMSIRERLEELDLSDNELQLSGLSFRNFPKLKQLSLRNNGFTVLSSSVLQFPDNSVLEYLDISCNELEQINSAVFELLPPSLLQLNMTFCPSVPYNEETAPKIMPNAFSGLRGVDKLSIANGFLGIDLLQKLDQLPNKNNKELILDNNGIRELNPGLFPTLRLTVLHLRNNQIQTLLPAGASFNSPAFTGLQKLDLASNQISAVQNHELVGLASLTTLFLERNNLTHLPNGIFDNTPKLSAVYLQDNLLSSVHHLFQSTGDQLKTLAVERNRIRKISKNDFSRLRNLDYLYLHGNPTEVIEQGAFDGLNNRVAMGLPSNNLTCDCRNAWLGDYIKERNFHNFFAARSEDLYNPFGSLVITHIPKCVHRHGHRSYITEQIESGTCPKPDSGTTVASRSSDAPKQQTSFAKLFGVMLLSGLFWCKF